MHRTKVAPLYIILAGCLWGSMGLFVRRLGFMGLDSMGIVELRSILAVILLFAVTALRSPNQLKVTKHNLISLASSGIFSIIFFNYCYFSTIRLLNLSAAAILLYTAPIFVMLLSILLFHETLTVRKVLALCMAFAGCCLVSGIASASQRLSLQGILLGLGSGFGYALYSIFSRVSLNQGLGSVTITGLHLSLCRNCRCISHGLFSVCHRFFRLRRGIYPAGGGLYHCHHSTALPALYCRAFSGRKRHCLNSRLRRTCSCNDFRICSVLRSANHPVLPGHCASAGSADFAERKKERK